MITKILPLQFLKKSPFYGSCGKMRYRLMKQEDALSLCVYPGPFALDHTPEEKKRFYTFAFSDQGYDQAIECLNREYESVDWEEEETPF